MPVKEVKLFAAPGSVFCPECREACMMISYDDARVVYRHGMSNQKALDCKNKSKVWAMKQPTVAVTEL